MKRIRLTIEDLFNIPTAEIFNPDSLNKLTAVSADSRNMPPDSVFVAIEGVNFDGHDFIDDAILNGAAAVMINRKKSSQLDRIDLPAIVVDDTILALGALASIWRKKLSTKIIAITGSAGKTTTKEMLASVLSIKYRVNKTIANYNNHIGVPLTILSTRNNHEILIAELGTNHFGEIRYTADICAPDFALVTNIGSSHLEFLKDKKGVLKEKGVLFDITAEQGGTLFVNYDDTLIRKYSQKFTNKITYGFSGDPDVKGIIKNYNGEGFPELEIKYKNRKLNITVPLPGEQSAFNFLAVCTTALKLGLKKEEIIEGLRKFKNISKRLNITKYRNFTLIDDTYNANPESMRYSLILLSKYGNKNKVAILGDMFELGADAAEHHKRLAKVIGKEKINEVYTIGGLMKSLFDELQDKKLKTSHFVDRQTLKNFLQEHSFNDTVVLVKGSRGMQMEEFVEILQAKKG